MSTDHPHQEEMHSSPPKPDRQASLCSESENLAPTQSGSTTGSDDQIHPAATNSTIVASPDLSLAPPLKDHAFPVDVKRLGSEAESTTSLTPTGDGQTSPMAKREQPHQSKEFQKQKRLNIHWSTSDDDNQTSIYGYHPLAMILLFLGGMLGAIGHHLYNQRLSGRQVVSAAWPQRWGIALAFFIKMMLGAAVQIAFKQMAWVRLFFCIIYFDLRKK